MAEHIGSKVAIPGTRGHGTLRYFGPIRGKTGAFGGIELSGALATLRGKNSGSVDGVNYFSVEVPSSGLFLPWDKLIQANPFLLSNVIPRAKLANQANGLHSPNGVSLSKKSSTSLLGTPRAVSPIPNRNLVVSPPSRNSFHDQMKRSSVNSRDLEQELHDLKTKYFLSQAEMQEKMQILNELQSTVDEIHPLLEEYEQNLTEKDLLLCKQRKDIEELEKNLEVKLQKQKKEFDLAREQWRESIDLMTVNQQENEEYYVSQIEQLMETVKSREGLEKTGKDNDSVDSTKFKDLEEEILLLKEKLKDNQSKENDDVDTLIKDKELQIESLTKALAKLEKLKNLEIEELKAQLLTASSDSTTKEGSAKLLQSKDENIVQLQEKLDTLNTEVDQSLKDQLEKLSLSSVKDMAEIERLKKDVEGAKKALTNSEQQDLTESSKEKEVEIAKLKSELMLLKDSNRDSADYEELFIQILKQKFEISKLEEQLEIAKVDNNDIEPKANIQNQNEISDLKQKITELEKANKLLTDKQATKDLNEISSDADSKEIKDLRESLQNLKASTILIEEYNKLEKSYEEFKVMHLELQRSTSAEAAKLKEITCDLELLEKENKKYKAEIDRAKDNNLSDRLKLLVQENIAIKEAMAEADQTTLIENLQLKVEELTKELEVASGDSNMEVENLTKEVEKLAKANKERKSNAMPQNADHIEVNELKQELEKLQKELAAKGDSGQSKLASELEKLKHQLEMRPTFDELVELQNSIEELETLHKQEVDAKDSEIAELKKEIEKLNERLSDVQSSKAESNGNTVSKAAPVQKQPLVNSDSLPIYEPADKIDPSVGKDDWCGLCERDGHSSISCPYENDIF